MTGGTTDASVAWRTRLEAVLTPVAFKERDDQVGIVLSECALDSDTTAFVEPFTTTALTCTFSTVDNVESTAAAQVVDSVIIDSATAIESLNVIVDDDEGSRVIKGLTLTVVVDESSSEKPVINDTAVVAMMVEPPITVTESVDSLEEDESGSPLAPLVSPTKAKSPLLSLSSPFKALLATMSPYMSSPTPNTTLALSANVSPTPPIVMISSSSSTVAPTSPSTLESFLQPLPLPAPAAVVTVTSSIYTIPPVILSTRSRTESISSSHINTNNGRSRANSISSVDSMDSISRGGMGRARDAARARYGGGGGGGGRSRRQSLDAIVLPEIATPTGSLDSPSSKLMPENVLVVVAPPPCACRHGDAKRGCTGCGSSLGAGNTTTTTTSSSLTGSLWSSVFGGGGAAERLAPHRHCPSCSGFFCMKCTEGAHATHALLGATPGMREALTLAGVHPSKISCSGCAGGSLLSGVLSIKASAALQAALLGLPLPG